MYFEWRSLRSNRSRVMPLFIVGLICISAFGCGNSSPSTKAKDEKSTENRSARKPNKSAKTTPVDPSVHRPSEAEQNQGFSSVNSEADVRNQSSPEPVYRPNDRRPVQDDVRLASLGIRSFQSKHLKLYTDISPELAQDLPLVIDAVYPAWVDYFGDLPPDRSGRAFQMTGYLIRDEALFREAGLVPEDLPMFEHGRHRANEFWMREQNYDYFRRHLLIHEATHCFMTFMPQTHAPVWYIEGMAEHFATHRRDENGAYQFRVMPDSRDAFAGWGRITGISNEQADGRSKTIDEIAAIPAASFLTTVPYSWAWGLCSFFDSHPRYKMAFRELGKHTQDGSFESAFAAMLNGLETDERRRRDIDVEWSLFTANLCYGYDSTRAAIDFKRGEPLKSSKLRLDIAADRGWQSTGLRIEMGRRYRLTVGGHVTVADLPKPWITEPQGITIRYVEGRPLGQVIGCLREEFEVPPSDDSNKALNRREVDSMRKTFVIGEGTTIDGKSSGTLYLRLNDAWNSLHDNRGHFQVEIEEVIAEQK